MAASRTVLMADTPGARQLIVPGESGELVNDKTPEAWAAAITAALQDPHRLAQLGVNAKARAEQNFPFARMIEAHLSVLRAIAGKGKRSDPVSRKDPSS
jgi:glycosyltransferase involved in cell wall biosynthesis